MTSERGTMRGVVRRGERRVEVVDVPRPHLEPGTAIVRVRTSGICGSDLHLYRRNEQQQRPQGHEIAGEVVAISPRADGLRGEGQQVREGDRVAIDTICLGRGCGECRWCREGAPFHCQQKREGPDWSGAFAEYIKRDVRGLFPLPVSVDFERGALVEPLAVAVHALRAAGLQEGESVAVIGAGTIGMTTLAGAVAMGAGAVYVLARHEHQAVLARELGATEALLEGREAATARVREHTGGEGVDLVVETVGGEARTLDLGWPMVRRRGRVVALGLFGRHVPVDLSTPLGREVRLLFCNCYGKQDGRYDYDVALELIASGKAPVEKLLTHRFTLEQAPAAFATADDKATRSVKVQFALA